MNKLHLAIELRTYEEKFKMGKAYTVKDLMAEWKCTDSAVRKKIKQNDFNSIQVTIRGRTIDAYQISNDKLQEIKQDILDNKKTYFGKESIDDCLEAEYQSIDSEGKTYNESIDESFKNDNLERIDVASQINKCLYIVNDMVVQQVSIVKDVYEERLKEKDKKVYLLEDSENSIKSEIYELRAKNKTYEERIALSEKEIAQLKSDKDEQALRIKRLVADNTKLSRTIQMQKLEIEEIETKSLWQKILPTYAKKITHKEAIRRSRILDTEEYGFSETEEDR